MNTASPLRIALVTYSTKPRGSVVHTLELAEALHRLGQAVCVYALDKDGTGFDRAPACDYQLVPARSAPAEVDALIQQRIQELGDELSQFKRPHDIYHAQDCISANALARVRDEIPRTATSRTIPHFVRTVHHIEDFNSPYLQACQERSLHAPDLCLCVSAIWQEALWRQYQIRASRVLNGVNAQRFTPTLDGSEAALQQRLGLTGTPIFLTVGGIEPRKNSIALLQAFRQVLTSFPQAQLIIAGGETLFDYRPYREQFFAIAHTLNIELNRSIILPGVIPEQDLPALYRTADAFVFPSVTEGWGLVVLEAIASGLPVITSNQPPFTEFLSAQQALLVEPSSPEAIASAMIAVTDSTLARLLVAQSQSILPRYTWDASAQMHLHHYHGLRYGESSGWNPQLSDRISPSSLSL
ncbi:MSMEG_0565 family glycosyltransferase [Oculatella sp. LEGE 06141]|uniref:MSMEG_0565 family glycosyltransferase n=1 Tax=Oculatella sp. LEGE 06141 TaxID=1828648 RepID=UPI00187FFAB7|nr:MSMEG_0565 family glycosyltransferase [Oculatella sp. LEGE 06141]MBE9181268.1 MSMEG_0565 family glycosyltransferase [Oculatella sp. LEGE 06141]